MTRHNPNYFPNGVIHRGVLLKSQVWKDVQTALSTPPSAAIEEAYRQWNLTVDDANAALLAWAGYDADRKHVAVMEATAFRVSLLAFLATTEPEVTEQEVEEELERE
ncbi:hypothetical protein HDU96_002087 [Phlyctochytrium bullatum]|nr:hypothetical protein HDU96_002087 [Phlyctochytrium bullatum]